MYQSPQYRIVALSGVLLLIFTCCDGAGNDDVMDSGTGGDGGVLVDANTNADADTNVDAEIEPDAETSAVEPPFGDSSGGTGGVTAPDGSPATADGVSYIIIVPGSYQQTTPNRLMIVYSGTEGGQAMTSNLLQVASYSGLGDVIFAVLDGTTYYGNGAAGATVLDDVRARYNIDNDRTFLLSESAGTSAGLQLGFDLRQSYFAAFWANDVNAQSIPSQTAAELGFAPWGNAGPGGDYPDANAIVAGMQSAGYRLPTDAPYSGTGAGTHGSTEQFLAAVGFFNGKSRQ